MFDGEGGTECGLGAGSGLAEYTLGPGAVRKASGTLACLDLTLVGGPSSSTRC